MAPKNTAQRLLSTLNVKYISVTFNHQGVCVKFSKPLLFLLLILINSSAFADSMCVVEMTTRNGQVIQTFQDYRCSDASYSCERELEDRLNNGGVQAQCVVSRRPEEAVEWVQIQEVMFRDKKTAIAIANCRAALNQDFRCQDRNYRCGTCSEVAHSDQSSYTVWQNIRRGGGNGGGYNPPRPPRNPNPPRTPIREFVQSYHFTDRKTAIAYQNCNIARQQLPHCSTRGYECTPCTQESHTDHSQFDLYVIR